MKTMNRYLGLSLILSLFCIGAESDSGRPELHPAPHITGFIETDWEWTILPRVDVYEVGASKMALSSIRNLPESGFRKLTEAEAIGYTGAYYHCPFGKTPYLVRAVYLKGGLGGFRAEQHGDSLAIVNVGRLPIYTSEPEEYEKSASVINLDFTPTKIYSEVSCLP